MMAITIGVERTAEVTQEKDRDQFRGNVELVANSKANTAAPR